MVELLYQRGLINISKLVLTKPECEEIISELDGFNANKCEIEITINNLSIIVRFISKSYCKTVEREIKYIWGLINPLSILGII